MKKFVCLIILSVLLMADCNRLFTLKINKPIVLKDILSSIAAECDYSIITKDKESQILLNSKIDFINLKNVTLKELLQTIFDSKGLFFDFKDKKIELSFYKTKTFNINFIPNAISGSSNLYASNNTLNANYKFNFWENLKNHLVQLLKNIDNKNFKEPIIDKNSALVTITGNKKQLEVITKYINKLKHELHKEVLIDVKIYSVELSKSHKTGIDWSKFSLSLPNTSVPLRASYIAGSQSIFNSATFNTKAFLNFLSQNGNVNSISNPKIATLNNQKAIISIGTTVYYKYASNIVNRTEGNPTTEYTIDSKFVGILLDITPQISDNGDIILSINPRISAFKDPLQLNSQQRDMPPDTKDNSLMSVVKLKDNQTLVLGGLITNDENLKVNGVSILKEIPLIKYLFSSREKVSNKKELVFVITPHIINFKEKKTLKDLGFSKLPSLEDLDE